MINDDKKIQLCIKYNQFKTKEIDERKNKKIEKKNLKECISKISSPQGWFQERAITPPKEEDSNPHWWLSILFFISFPSTS